MAKECGDWVFSKSLFLLSFLFMFQLNLSQGVGRVVVERHSCISRKNLVGGLLVFGMPTYVPVVSSFDGFLTIFGRSSDGLLTYAASHTYVPTYSSLIARSKGHWSVRSV